MVSSVKKSIARASVPAEPDLEAAADSVEQAAATVVGPVAEIQENVRTAIEKIVAEPRAAFARAKASADEAASAFELSFAAAKNCVTAMNAKALEALCANAEANLDFIKASFAAKSLSELVELQGEFARGRVEAMSAQVKDLGALAQKAVIETIEPVRDQVAKSFTIAA